ncbi:MAG: tRNA 2-thiouridine(34) synthase MnmA [Candidatus Promineifilaceae bacterium]
MKVSLSGTGASAAPVKGRVVVAMSGGVDSSVAAALLVAQGYEVVGMMLRLWSEEGGAAANRCCTPDQMADARRVAEALDIPFYALDVQNYFRNTIVQFFIDEHARGRTPNPCIECNRTIRFGYLLQQALGLGASYLATGHYARTRPTPAGFELLRAVDARKDQSYVLHVLGQEALGRAIFPIGGYTKAEVRQLAEEYGLGVAGKHESQDLCFLADGDHRRFLGEHAPDLEAAGAIETVGGRLLGQHQGLHNYTLGQRKGLGVAAGSPLFVVDKDMSRNVLVVGSREQASTRHFTLRSVNWVAGRPPDARFQAAAQVRYKSQPLSAAVEALPESRAVVTLAEPALGVTPGQGAVFYLGDVCLGGGLIEDHRP